MNFSKLRRRKVILLIFVLIIPMIIISNLLINSNKADNNDEISINITGAWDTASLDGIEIGTVNANGATNPRTKYGTYVTYLEARGAQLSDISGNIDSTALANYDVIWFDEGGTGLSGGELNNLEIWISAGGGFIITGDNADDNAEDLLNNFEIIKIEWGHSGTTEEISSHPITAGVKEIYFGWAQESLDISENPKVDTCVTKYGVVKIAAFQYGIGRSVFIMEDLPSDYGSSDNKILLDNSFGWISRRGQGTGGGSVAVNKIEYIEPLIETLVILGIIGFISYLVINQINKQEITRLRERK